MNALPARFGRLWLAQSISLLGTQVTFMALPLTAVLWLDAGAVEMGLLRAVEWAPFVVFGLAAGVWIDRLPRVPVLVLTNLGRALLLASIPLLALSGALTLAWLYVAAFAVGTLALGFELAYQTLLPAIVPREQLLAANSRLQTSQAVAYVAGPGLGTALVEVLTAPLAIVADVVSYLIAAGFLATLRGAEQPRAAWPTPTWSALTEGLRVVAGDPCCARWPGSSATANVASNVLLAVLVLFVTQELNAGAIGLGYCLALFGCGGVVGGLAGGRVAARLGIGRALSLELGLASAGCLGVACAGLGPSWLMLPLLGLGAGLFGLGATSYNAAQISLRQARVPSELQGRVNATMRFVISGAIPVGGLVGGVLGQVLGLRPAAFLAALMLAGAVPWLLASPVARLVSLTLASGSPDSHQS